MEWKKCTINDIGKIITGKTPRTSIKENYGGDIPFLTPSDELTNKTAPVTSKTLTEQGLTEVRKCLLPSMSICVSCIGSDLGKAVLTNRPLVTNQQINSIIPYSQNDANFIYYLMCIIGKELNFISKTSTAVPIINKTTFSNWEITIPQNKEDQQKIASILSSLDRKIELNNAINKNLEEQAQAIFKNWFIDFEPFKNGKFVESEIGMIPEGWKIVRIADIPHSIETGRRPKGGVGNLNTGIPSVGAEHVKGLGNYDYSKTKYISEEYASTLKTGKVNGYELLIYKDGGRPGFFIPNYSIFGEGYPYDTCFLNEHVFKVDFNNKQFNCFCYFYFHNDYVFNYLNAQGGKAAIPGINRQDVESLWIFDPQNPKIIEFGNIVFPIIKTILKNCNQNRRLASLRDTLLPRLMSGEIEV